MSVVRLQGRQTHLSAVFVFLSSTAASSNRPDYIAILNNRYGALGWHYLSPLSGEHRLYDWVVGGDVAAGAALILAAGGEVWLPKGGHLLWNRPRPRFRSFAGARAGVRPVAERYM